MLANCALQIHEPTVNHEVKGEDKPWQIHCETARTYDANTQDVPGAVGRDWVFARDEDGELFSLRGKLVDGFFEVSLAISYSSRHW